MKIRQSVANFPGGFPASFAEYAANPLTHNTVLKSLLGKPIYSTEPISQEDLELVLDALGGLCTVYGLTENFEETVTNLRRMTDVDPVNSTRFLRAAVFKEPRAADWSAISEKFKIDNALDVSLYEEVKRRFQKQMPSSTHPVALKPQPAKLSDRYYSVALYAFGSGIKYLILLYGPNNAFVSAHSSALQSIQEQAKKTERQARGQNFGLMNGKKLIEEWLKLFGLKFPVHASFLSELEETEPLYRLKALAAHLKQATIGGLWGVTEIEAS